MLGPIRNADAVSLASAAASLDLVAIDVDEDAIPERLHVVKNESLFAVEIACPQFISVEEIARRTNEQRQPVPEALEKQRALVGIAERVLAGTGCSVRPTCFFLDRLTDGVTVVLFNPDADGSLVLVV